MRWFFSRRDPGNKPVLHQPTNDTGKLQSLIVAKPERLLEAHSALIENLYSFSQLDRARFEHLYVELFRNIARYVQLLPASEQHHHAYLGGLLEHTIEVATFAGRIAGKFLFTSDGEERISESSALYVFAMVSAAAMHDIGKILTDIDVVVIRGKNKSRWLPHLGPMNIGEHYIFQFSSNRVQGLHEPAGMLLAFTIMPPSAMGWIWQKPTIRNEWIATVGGKAMDAGGNIGRCVIECDSASTGINMKNAPVVKAAEANEMTIGARPPLHQLALKGIRMSFRDFPPNSERNPYWVSQEFVACISPRFTEVIKSALGTESQYLPENSSLIYDAMGDAGMLIPNLTNKAVHSLLFSEKAKPLAAILVKREIIDPDRTLPVYMGKLLCPTMPENLHHKIAGRPEHQGTASTQQTLTNATPMNTVTAPVLVTEQQTESAPVQQAQRSKGVELPPPLMKQRNHKPSTKPIVAQNEKVEPSPSSSYVEQEAVDTTPENNSYQLTVPVQNENDFKAYLAQNPMPGVNQDTTNSRLSGVERIGGVIPTQQELTPTAPSPRLHVRSHVEPTIGDREERAKLFFEWIRAQVLSGKLAINARGGELHVVDGNRLAMVTPSIFTKYLTFITNQLPGAENDIKKQTKTLQHAVLEHYKFAKSFSGSNIIKCEFVGARNRHVIHVMVLSEPDSRALNLDLHTRGKNTFLSLSEPC